MVVLGGMAVSYEQGTPVRCRVFGSEFRTQGLGFKLKCLGFRVYALGLCFLWGLCFMVHELGFRVWGLRFRVVG